jgi:excisionase family DNA binding protein
LPRTYYTSPEVAAMFQVSPKTIARWADDGRLPATRTPGGHRRFPVPAIDALLAQAVPGPAAPGPPRPAIEALVTRYFNGDGTAALLEVASVCQIAVTYLDRNHFAAYLRRRNHILTDQEWARIAEQLNHGLAEVFDDVCKELLGRHVQTVLTAASVMTRPTQGNL